MRAVFVAMILAVGALAVGVPQAQAQTYGAGYTGAPAAGAYGYGFCPPHGLVFGSLPSQSTYRQPTSGSASSQTTLVQPTSGYGYIWWPTMGFHYGYTATDVPPALTTATVPAN
jgi:hypothetical protein